MNSGVLRAPGLFFMNNKPFTNYNEQLNLLESRGIDLSTSDLKGRAKRYLQHEGYHSLAAQCGITRVGKATNEAMDAALSVLNDRVVIEDDQISIK